jgi:hypothetical protein
LALDLDQLLPKEKDDAGPARRGRAGGAVLAAAHAIDRLTRDRLTHEAGWLLPGRERAVELRRHWAGLRRCTGGTRHET